MSEFLKILSAEVGPNDHVVLVLDNAGWHVCKKLVWPPNITPLWLPPYSPELNSIERLWAYIKSHYLSNRVYASYDELLAAGSDAYRALTPEIIKSVCATSWITPAIQL